MCLTASEPPTMRSKAQTHLHIRNITRRRRLLREQKEMEMRNLNLFLENQSIIGENEALKRKALLLHQENNALFSLLHPKLSSVSTTFL
ncbi:Protein LITTLE ZIPPER 2 [Cardamine amara subsp. amara]|uniref:Protein LITTLE ZIPPER 2 n=1 Tax=Cardamine amara subsp. amara TaxID=228776 RepID=A0ABD1BPV7_CARAN